MNVAISHNTYNMTKSYVKYATNAKEKRKKEVDNTVDNTVIYPSCINFIWHGACLEMAMAKDVWYTNNLSIRRWLVLSTMFQTLIMALIFVLRYGGNAILLIYFLVLEKKIFNIMIVQCHVICMFSSKFCDSFEMGTWKIIEYCFKLQKGVKNSIAYEFQKVQRFITCKLWSCFFI